MYDVTLDWTQLSRTIGEHSTHLVNVTILNINNLYLYGINTNNFLTDLFDP